MTQYKAENPELITRYCLTIKTDDGEDDRLAIIDIAHREVIYWTVRGSYSSDELGPISNAMAETLIQEGLIDACPCAICGSQNLKSQ